MANSTFVGLFEDRDAAQHAVGDLVSAGIDRDKISVVANDASGNAQTSSVDSDGNLAAEGASAGISSGAVVGGVAGLLIGAGFTFLPIAGFLLAGPIAGLIAGAAAGAATGGIVGGLIGLGIPQEHAELYAEGVRRGGTLVTVQADSSMDSRVRDILDRDGAVDIEDRGAAWKTSGYTGYDKNAKPLTEAEIADERARYATSAINSDWSDTSSAPAPSNDATYATGSTYGTEARNDLTTSTTGSLPTTSTNTNLTPGGDKLEVVQENLQVGKREVERGGMRVRSFVTETPVNEQVTLREEHVDVQRTPVDRPATADAFQAGTIEMRETAEVPVVAKEARVVEEISLNKTASERTETVSDTVRRTDFEVENLTSDADYDRSYRTHFAQSNPTGNYEQYAPAYQYGRQLAGSGTGDWDTNESTYRTNWENSNPGTWDTFKDSVRHAYDSAKNTVTGGSDSNRATLR